MVNRWGVISVFRRSRYSMGPAFPCLPVTMQLCNPSLHIHGHRKEALNCCKERNEVRWRPRARSMFGAPMFEHEVFRKQMYCTEVLVTLLGLFGALIVIRRTGNCAP